ncbi:MAG: hypothetical protein IJU14_01615 [Clostridia bacterium]|nr:hypothetical protein [Clostridia bacterium]
MIDNYTSELSHSYSKNTQAKTPKFKALDINARIFDDDLEYEDFDDIYDDEDIQQLPQQN